MTGRQGEASGDRDAPRVLVVDDAPAIRHALRGVLEDAGIDVVGEAPDGVEGVALAGSLRPDVVLMDLRMPAADGIRAVLGGRSDLFCCRYLAPGGTGPYQVAVSPLAGGDGAVVTHRPEGALR